ncbi:MAG: hypothetical protein ACRD1C_05180 [Terriglobales bacterium]
MKYLRQFGALVLLVASFLAPAMACMIPDAPMTMPERACCRTMPGTCGETSMPASHACCRKTLSGVYDRACDTNAGAFRPVATPVFDLALSELLMPAPVAAARVERPDISPPTSPPLSASILRI